MKSNSNNMSIVIDNKYKDSTYIDKDNYIVAKDKEIVRLLDVMSEDDIIYKVSIITGISAGLYGEELNVLYLLNKLYKEDNHISTVREAYIAKYNKSVSTFNRAINTLIKKHIITYNIKGDYNINPNYDASEFNEFAKYIVIKI